MKKASITFLLAVTTAICFGQTNKLENTGNVGIGTNTPSSLFEISSSGGTITSDGSGMTFNRINNSCGVWLQLGNNGIGHWTMKNGLDGCGNLGDLNFINAGQNHVFTLKQSGFVGVGTTNPTALFEVASDGGSFKTVGNGIKINRSNASCGVLVELGNNGNVDWILKNGLNGCGNLGDLNFINANQYHALTIKQNGNIGVGITNPDSRLAVDGKIRSEEVKVEIINGPDYVFEPDYELRTLKETKEYIVENKHLPEIPPAKEMEANGVDLGDMNMRLLKKIEELTLYQIQLMEEMEVMKKELQELKK